MVKIIEVKKQDAEHLLGTFLDDSHYDTLIDYDCDVYLVDPMSPQPHSEETCILKFRKGYFSKAEQEGAYNGLKDAAQQSQNRGLAAGPKGDKCLNRDWATIEQMDILNYLSKVEQPFTQDDIDTIKARAAVKEETRGMVWLTAEKTRLGFDWTRWLNSMIHDSVTGHKSIETLRNQAQWVLDTLISDTTYANPVDSGIAGWFDRYPRIPYGRATAYTQHNPDKFRLCYPFMTTLGKAFHDLLPVRYANQMACADQLDPAFRIPGTPFTTITVNKNFRTAAHRDAGDLASGFSNLTVVAKDNDYTGAYLVLPEVRAAVNIRPGDLLLVSNHDFIHGNTPLVAKAGVDLERISLVCYFREAMLELGPKAYEDLRYQFVETRRKDQSHPLWEKGWNGVSKGMWDSDEWFDFLRVNDGEQFISQFHATEQQSSLEALFG